MKNDKLENNIIKKQLLNKAFTIIELLAVMIIMAIIAIIATPIITNLLENVREEARRDSVIGYADSVRMSYAEEILNPTGKPLDELASSKMQGDKVVCQYVTYDEERYGALLHTCKVNDIGDYCFYNGRVYKGKTQECNEIYNMISNGIPYYKPIITTSQTPEDSEYAQSVEVKVEYPKSVAEEEKYFIKIDNNLEINNVIGKCSTNETPDSCTTENVNSIEANTWYELSGDTTFTTNKNINIEAIIGANNEYGGKEIKTIDNIDNSGPEVSIKSISTTSDKAIVMAQCSDTDALNNGSGITKYEYKINEEEWIDAGTNDIYTFEKLTQNTSYKFKVRCTNGSGLTNEVEVEKTTLELIAPTIEQISQVPKKSTIYPTYAQSRTIKITYNSENIENPKYYYSYDGENWIEVNDSTYEETFTAPGYLYAKTEDGSGNVAQAATYTIANIDTTLPVATIERISTTIDKAIIKASCTDTQSGIVMYGFSSDGGNKYKGIASSSSTSITNTFTGLTPGSEYTFAVRCTDGAANVGEPAIQKAKTTEIPAPTIEPISQTPEETTYAKQRTIRITYSGTNVQSPKYYFKSDISTEMLDINTENVASTLYECGTGTIPSTCSSATSGRIEANTWYKVNKTIVDLVYSDEGNLYAYTMDSSNNESLQSTYTIAKIDWKIPVITSATPSSDTNSINITATDDKSGIVSVGYKDINSSNIIWTNVNATTSLNYNITGINYGTTYEIWVKDEVGNISSSIKTTTVPTYWCDINIYNPNGVQDYATATFSASFDGGNTWETGLKNESESSTVVKGTTIIIKDLVPLESYYEYSHTEGTTYENNQWSYTVTEPNHVMSIYTKYKKYRVDVNPVIDGTTYGSGKDGYTFDVYVNGSLVADNVKDFCQDLEYGSQVQVIPNSVTGYSNSTAVTQTVGTNGLSFNPTWTINTYTFNINVYNPSGDEDYKAATFSVSYDGGSTWSTNQTNETVYSLKYGQTVIIKDLVPYYSSFEYSKSSGATYDSSKGTWTYTATSNNTIEIWMKNKASVGQTWNFAYNGTTGGDGSVQTFKAPVAGTYKLEVWGAQGANSTNSTGSDSSVGGYGGYSYGEVSLSTNQELYVTVGGHPGTYANGSCESNCENVSGVIPGYNGGGKGGYYYSTTSYQGKGSSGGGATHIAINNNRGVLSNYSSYQSEVLIVAGGGGGAGYIKYHGGDGGGIYGIMATYLQYDEDDNKVNKFFGPTGSEAYSVSNSGSSIKATTQTQGGGGYGNYGQDGTFGQGGSADSWYAGGGGGGGLYGGGCGGPNDHNGGTGGSGYIGNGLLSNKGMYSYQTTVTSKDEYVNWCIGSTDSNTKTTCTTNVSSDPISNYAKQGHGYARITLISVLNQLNNSSPVIEYITEDYDDGETTDYKYYVTDDLELDYYTVENYTLGTVVETTTLLGTSATGTTDSVENGYQYEFCVYDTYGYASCKYLYP